MNILQSHKIDSVTIDNISYCGTVQVGIITDTDELERDCDKNFDFLPTPIDIEFSFMYNEKMQTAKVVAILEDTDELCETCSTELQKLTFDFVCSDNSTHKVELLIHYL